MTRPAPFTEPPAGPWRIRDLPITDVPLPAGFVTDDEPGCLSHPLDAVPTVDDAPSPSSMLGVLAGVAVDDGGADDLLEQRSARDRPRLALEPRHATIIILILVLALSLSLTLLVQQGMRLSSMSWDGGDARASSIPSASPSASSSSPEPTPSESSSSPDANVPVEPSAEPSAAPTATSTLIDLNTATAEQLQTIKGIGPVTAQRIIDHRTTIGRYTSVDQLLDVSGIGAKTLEKIRPYVEVRP